MYIKTEVVNKRKFPYNVYIGRPSEFGNPFEIGPDGDRDEVISKFESYFLRKINSSIDFRNKVQSLRGKILGCFCKPKKCHGDIIVQWLINNPE